MLSFWIILLHLFSCISESEANKFAYATMLSTPNRHYAIGIQAVGKMLKDVVGMRSDIDLVCMVAREIRDFYPEFMERVYERFNFYGIRIKIVESISNPDQMHLQRKWFDSTYTKLNVIALYCNFV
jgi:hypothetical protein